MKYIGGVSDIRNTLPLHQLLLSSERSTNITKSNILMAVDPEKKKFFIARCPPDHQSRTKVPIKVGDTILWDNRFRISLMSQWKQNDSGESRLSDSREFYIRHLNRSDWQHMFKGGVRFKHPVYARGGLPVVVDREGEIVVIPHFRVSSREEKVVGRVKFSPIRSLDALLQYSHYHTYK